VIFELSYSDKTAKQKLKTKKRGIKNGKESCASNRPADMR
jgi:hypothetical protein